MLASTTAISSIQSYQNTQSIAGGQYFVCRNLRGIANQRSKVSDKQNYVPPLNNEITNQTVQFRCDEFYNPPRIITGLILKTMINQPLAAQRSASKKTLQQKIDVVAEFHAHKIAPERIAYRTGIELQLVLTLVNGESHQRLFSLLLGRHRKSRRDQRLKKSLRNKGIGQAEMQDRIEQEYLESLKQGIQN